MYQYHQETIQDIKALIGIKDTIDGGYFRSLDDAVKVRQKKANEVFGEYVNKCEQQNIIIQVPKNKKIKKIEIEFYDDEYKRLERELEEIINK